MRHEIEVSEFSAVIQEFAAYKSAIQGCSQRTVEEYLLDLRTFFRYLLCREDTEVLNLYWSYIKLGREGREAYEKQYGPILQTDVTPGSFKWLNDPWPWDLEGEK